MVQPFESSVLAALLAVACAALAGLLFAERTQRQLLKYVCKPTCSACFVLVGLHAARHGGSASHVGHVALLTLLGLCCGAVGDVLLMIPRSGYFLAGLGSFLLGHIAYAVAFAVRAPPPVQLLWPAAIVLLLLGAIVMRWLQPGLGRYGPAVIAYLVTTAVMVLAALGVWLRDVPQGTLIAAGAVLFAASDVAVARERFVAREFINKAWGLPAYYAAQLLIACSLAR